MAAMLTYTCRSWSSSKLWLVLCVPLFLHSCTHSQLQRPEVSLSDGVIPAAPGTALLTAETDKAGKTGASTASKRDDLIGKIIRGFALPQYDDPEIAAQINWHLQNPAYLQRVWKRAEPYLHHVVSEVERRGLPMELALLPIVESGYQPYGYSHARAAGLWQFIPSTGRHFGLQQTWWIDQRRDLIASTDAALTYLSQLHARFDQDWLKALAAYNAGGGRIQRAIRKSGKTATEVHFSELDLNRETRAYVPKLLALAQLLAQADEHGVVLPEIADEPYFSVVDTGGQIDLTQLMRLADISETELRRLNPAFNRWASPPDGPHRVLVPEDAAPRLRQGLAKIPDEQRVAWKRHRIESGETLGAIAHQYQTTVSVLKQSNQLSSNIIRAGHHLLIPSAAAMPVPLASSCIGDPLYHQVQSGDTLWELARHYGVSINHLKRCNPGLSSSTLALNSQLRIRDQLRYAAAPQPPVQEAVNKVVNYRVRRGDSLARISSRFGVTVKQLVAWNALDPSRYIQPGERLIVKVNLLNQS